MQVFVLQEFIFSFLTPSRLPCNNAWRMMSDSTHLPLLPLHSQTQVLAFVLYQFVVSFLLEPTAMKAFNHTLDRLKSDPRITVRLGSSDDIRDVFDKVPYFKGLGFGGSGFGQYSGAALEV